MVLLSFLNQQFVLLFSSLNFGIMSFFFLTYFIFMLGFSFCNGIGSLLLCLFFGCFLFNFKLLFLFFLRICVFFCLNSIGLIDCFLFYLILLFYFFLCFLYPLTASHNISYNRFFKYGAAIDVTHIDDVDIKRGIITGFSYVVRHFGKAIIGDNE